MEYRFALDPSPDNTGAVCFGIDEDGTGYGLGFTGRPLDVLRWMIVQIQTRQAHNDILVEIVLEHPPFHAAHQNSLGSATIGAYWCLLWNCEEFPSLNGVISVAPGAWKPTAKRNPLQEYPEFLKDKHQKDAFDMLRIVMLTRSSRKAKK